MLKATVRLSVISVIVLVIGNCSQQNPVSTMDQGLQSDAFKIAAVGTFIPSGDHATGKGSDGKLFIVARGTDGNLYYKKQTTDDGSAWQTDWTRIQKPTEGAIVGNVAVATLNDGLHIFAQCSNGQLVTTYQNGSSSFYPFALYQNTNIRYPIKVVAHPNSSYRKLTVIARANALNYLVYLQTNGTGNDNIFYRLTGEQPVDTIYDACRYDYAEATELFVRHRTSKALYRVRINNNNSNGAWTNMGGYVRGEIAAANNQDNRVEVFFNDNLQNLKHSYQTAYNGSYSGILPLSTSFPVYNYITAASNSDGRLELFVETVQGLVLHMYQVAPNGTWSDLQYFDNGNGSNSQKHISAGQNYNGMLSAFVFNSGEKKIRWSTLLTNPWGWTVFTAFANGYN